MSDIGDDDHVARHCSAMRIEDDGSPKPTAFALRRNKDKSLSVNWIEYFNAPDFNSRMIKVQNEASKHRDIRNGAFAILNVGNIKKTILKKLRLPLEIKLEHDYPSHAGIYGYTADNLQITHKLAEMVKPEDMFQVVVQNT